MNLPPALSYRLIRGIVNSGSGNREHPSVAKLYQSGPVPRQNRVPHTCASPKSCRAGCRTLYPSYRVRISDDLGRSPLRMPFRRVS
jgi:hypothetical protein